MSRCTCADDTQDIDLTLLEPVLKRFAAERSPVVAVLQGAQQVYGYLPEPVLAEVSRSLNLPYAEVYGVATFYTQFHLHPRGRNIVRICHGTACHVGGAPEVTRAITDELNIGVGETTEDLRFTVEAVACVGCCGLAPVVVVGDQVNGQVDPSTARKLAKKLLRETPK